MGVSEVNNGLRGSFSRSTDFHKLVGVFKTQAASKFQSRVELTDFIQSWVFRKNATFVVAQEVLSVFRSLTEYKDVGLFGQGFGQHEFRVARSGILCARAQFWNLAKTTFCIISGGRVSAISQRRCYVFPTISFFRKCKTQRNLVF